MNNDQQEIYKKVHDQPIFKGLSNKEFTEQMADCKLTYYQQSKKVDYFKTPDEGLLLILKGTAEIFIVDDDGKSFALEEVQEGEVIGLSNIAYYLGESNCPLDRHRLEIAVAVADDSYCLQIPYAVIKKEYTIRMSVALGDALTTAHLFIELLKRLEDKGILTLADLIRLKHSKLLLRTARF